MGMNSLVIVIQFSPDKTSQIPCHWREKAMITFAPFSPGSREVWYPSPLLAPVTIAIFPSSVDYGLPSVSLFSSVSFSFDRVKGPSCISFIQTL
jgi:hypothetical protein